VPYAYDISSLCLDYDAQLRGVVFISTVFTVALLVNFGFDLPLAALRSAACRRFVMNFRCT
jgi:hypothetical protein